MPLISICIPAYRQPVFLARLLDSICGQSFADFEVIVTDDSPDNAVGEVCNRYTGRLPIQYHHNTKSLGSPANWNRSIQYAGGKWIKLMHDDDWFAHTDSLQVFANAIREHPDAGFIFSGYAKWEGERKIAEHIPDKRVLRKLNRNPLNLIANNFIGHPSVTLIKNRNQEWYDENLKWVVDFEFYIRELKSSTACCISKSLIHIGVHSDQVTSQSFHNPTIEVPESLYLIKKLGVDILNHIRVYDHYWRLFRNLGFDNMDDIKSFSGEHEIPQKLASMWKFESKFPNEILKFGVISKLLMALSYCFNR